MSSPVDCSTPSVWSCKGNVSDVGGFTISNDANAQSEITFDYGRAEGGIPYIETSKVTSSGGLVQVDVIFSETHAGLESDTGMYFFAVECCS
jgi:hypothetical protein